MEGGLGNDVYGVDHLNDRVIERPGEGVDTVESRLEFYQLGANLENLILTGGTAQRGMGNELDNILTGNAFANRLLGGLGNDKLSGGDGNDELMGDAGRDTLSGGAGNDTLTGGAGADLFCFKAGEKGKDTLIGFKRSEGDRLDLSDVLSACKGYSFANKAAFLQFKTLSSTQAELRIDFDGAKSFGTPEAHIVLTHTDLVGSTLDGLFKSQVILA